MSPRARGREFPPGIMSMIGSYFHRKQREIEPKADRLASICHGLWEWIWKGMSTKFIYIIFRMRYEPHEYISITIINNYWMRFL